MKIYLVRHGETDWNQAGRLQGQTDIALNAQGLEQAREAAERLKEVPFEIAFCSPLIRAKRTAETIIGDRKITLTTDERLRELNFGPGKAWTSGASRMLPASLLLIRAATFPPWEQRVLHSCIKEAVNS